MSALAGSYPARSSTEARQATIIAGSLRMGATSTSAVVATQQSVRHLVRTAVPHAGRGAAGLVDIWSQEYDQARNLRHLNEALVSSQRKGRAVRDQGSARQANSEGPWTVGLVDDDAIVRAWVRLSLRDSEFRVVGEAGDGKGALELLERRRPALLVLDYALPDLAATELVRKLRFEGWTTPVLVITAAPRPGLNEAVLESGAQGVVVKRGSPDDLLRALRLVAAGQPVLDSEHPRRPPGEAALSPREREVLRLAAAGSTNKEIAEELGLGRETVKTLLSRTFAKLGARNRTEAVTIARERGVL
jgi:DNA-binding NarL/FixJ family response regulator